MFNKTALNSDLRVTALIASHAATEIAGIAVMEAVERHGELPAGDNGQFLANLILNRTYPHLRVGGIWRMGSFGIVLHTVQLGSFDVEEQFLKVDQDIGNTRFRI
ncbi:hypothetical protein BV898_08911 [Hypsibius exemplaris]|uniref:Uncharacterized protein n=1 Tax=Hypsibius exemplaris TaxID=2072580 RepID=A0A1W0WPE1_HYPEX|nr:hypothetical protein BV898_08911 [Hypsibius exemplaris]